MEIYNEQIYDLVNLKIFSFALTKEFTRLERMPKRESLSKDLLRKKLILIKAQWPYSWREKRRERWQQLL